MKKKLRSLSILATTLFFFQMTAGSVSASVCYASRTINQWYCSNGSNFICNASELQCAGPAPIGGSSCTTSGNTTYGYCNCIRVCLSYNTNSGGTCQQAAPIFGACNQTSCSVNATIKNCAYLLGVCNESTTTQPLSCWGPGSPPPVCGNNICETGETSATCPADCTTTPAYCGDSSCNGGETCSTCSSDCGTCTSIVCGDLICNGSETCSSCGVDCGTCIGPHCNDNICNNGETCSTCPNDCGSCVCNPSCFPQCGQQDGCGGTCPNTGVGTPATPTGLTPADGSSINSSLGQVILSWNVANLAQTYQVQVYPTGTPAGQECTVPNSHCPAASAGTSYTLILNAGVTGYTWRVRAMNTGCGSTQISTWTAPISFTLNGGFSGRFYDDATELAAINPGTGLCEKVGASALSAPTGSSVRAIWGANTTPGTVTGSSYTIDNVGYNANTLVSLSLPPGYRCTCPAGCSYSGIAQPLGNVHFFITTAPLNWWQTANGYLFAGTITGIGIQSQIPQSCASSGSCTAALSSYDSSNTPKSDGTSLTSGGSIDSTVDTGSSYSYLNQSGTNTHAEGMRLNGAKEDYTYFSQQYGITASTAVDFTGAQPVSNPNRAYYANGNVTINSQWTLNTADSLVIFVNGNLTISQPIRVAKGAFLAFIVKGNITFDKSLGSNVSNNPSVAGVYVANGQIISESNNPGDDLKLVGEGTFIGWSGVQLQRNFNNANVNRGGTEPIETFKFRPDFLVTVPEKMTKPIYLWQETN